MFLHFFAGIKRSDKHTPDTYIESTATTATQSAGREAADGEQWKIAAGMRGGRWSGTSVGRQTATTADAVATATATDSTITGGSTAASTTGAGVW